MFSGFFVLFAPSLTEEGFTRFLTGLNSCPRQNPHLDPEKVRPPILQLGPCLQEAIPQGTTVTVFRNGVYLPGFSA